jgi:glycerol kinase
MDLALRSWDAEIASDVFGIPLEVLPEIRPSTGPYFGRITGQEELGPVRITADVVDANAALFAQGCFSPDVVKITYGTGAFIAVSVGGEPRIPDNGLLPFVGWQIGDTVSYSVEGGVFDVGSAIEWLVAAGLVEAPEDTATSAAADTGGVVMVPSFTGLAAPRWDPRARAAVLGITLDTKPGQVVRAALEGIACSVADIVDAMVQSTRVSPVEVRVDGGPSRNALLMQLQADLIGHPIAVSHEPDLTAFGAALLAGVGADVLSVDDTLAFAVRRSVYEPRLTEDERLSRLHAWTAAVEAVTGYSASIRDGGA